MNLRLITLVAASFAAVLPALAAETLSGAGLAAVVSESKSVTPARFPNADTVVLLREQRVEVNADGGYIRKSTTRTKAVTEKGRRDLLSYETGFNVAYGYAKATALRIVKADGRVVELDPAKQSAVQQDPSSMEANIYDPNDKLLVVAIPGVEIGDTVEISLEEGEPKPRMKGAFADLTPFEGTQPVLRTRYTVVTPKSLPLARTVIKDGDETGIRFSKTEKGDTIEYAWEVSETPQAIPEPDMPSLHLCVRRLLVSTIPDWRTISRWYWEISEPHYKVTDDIRAKVDELTKGVTDREARLRAIFRFVSQDIRYMGITTETEAPGYEPHDVAMTFGKRYGVCRDKAALLVAMLRAAGYEAFPVLISAGGNHLDPEAPMPYFNHAITAVREADGSYRLMDTTNENTKELFPAYLSNCSYLVADPKGDTLRVAPVPSADAHMLTGETKLTVGKDGSLAGETVVNFGGINDTFYRGGLAQAKPDDIRRFVQTRVAAVLPGARVETVKLEPENLMDTSVPMKLRVTFTAPDFLADRDGRALLRTPFVAQVFGFASQQLAGATALEKRRFPVKLDIIAGVRERVTITLPETVREALALPADKVIDDANLSYSRKLRRDGRTLVGEIDLRMKRLDIPAADYPALRDDLREIARAGKRAALVSTDSGVKSDSRVLRRKALVTLGDDRSVSIRVEERRKILTYAGKKDNAELKLAWNTANPEPVLERAVVIDASGASHAVNPTEINILDAGWVASAPRYKPSRIKVVSLPNVEEGSEIDLAYSQVYRNLPTISWGEVFASADAVDADEVEIVAPASLRIFLENSAGARVVRDGDKVRVTVTRRLLPSPKEPATAPAKVWAPSLSFSTAHDDAAYAGALRTVISAKALPDDAVRAKAAALTEGLSSDAEKILALRDFVSKNIRQAGPAWGEAPAGDLSGAARTLADGYGSDADRHLLFTALLRAAGYDATPALFCTDELAVATRRPGEPVGGGFWNGFGTRLRLKDGDTIDFAYLNQYADWRVNAGDGDLVLPLDTGIPAVVKSAANSTDEKYAIAIDDKGDATVDYERTLRGEGATSFNAWGAELTPEGRDRYFQQVASGLSRDATLRGEPVIDRVGARLAYGATVADFAVIQERFAYFDLPHAAGEIFPGASESSRRLPYAVGGRSASRTVWSVDLPKGWKLSGEPKPLVWEGPSGIGRVTVSVVTETLADGSARLVRTRDIALRAGVVPAEAYPALVELNRRMKSPDTWRVLLEKE